MRGHFLLTITIILGSILAPGTTLPGRGAQSQCSWIALSDARATSTARFIPIESTVPVIPLTPTAGQQSQPLESRIARLEAQVNALSDTRDAYSPGHGSAISAHADQTAELQEQLRALQHELAAHQTQAAESAQAHDAQRTALQSEVAEGVAQRAVLLQRLQVMQRDIDQHAATQAENRALRQQLEREQAQNREMQHRLGIAGQQEEWLRQQTQAAELRAQQEASRGARARSTAEEMSSRARAARQGSAALAAALADEQALRLQMEEQFAARAPQPVTAPIDESVAILAERVVRLWHVALHNTEVLDTLREQDEYYKDLEIGIGDLDYSERVLAMMAEVFAPMSREERQQLAEAILRDPRPCDDSYYTTTDRSTTYFEPTNAAILGMLESAMLGGEITVPAVDW